MRGTAPPVEEEFDGARREARLDPLVHELIRHAVEIVVNLDVIIDVDATRLPFRQLVARLRQREERRPIELLKERTSADTGDLHRAFVDGVDPLANGGVQIGEGKERAMPQDRQDPALRDLDTHLRFGFVGGCGHAGGNDHRTIMAGELSVGPVDLRLVAVGDRDAALQIVRHPDGGTALKVVEHPHVCADPRRQILAPRGFGIDQAARAEHADEELDHDLLAGLRIDQVRARAGEIDKQLLASAVHLAHRRLECAHPPAISVTKLAVGIPARVLGAILQPQQRKRHARFLELLVELGPLGDHPVTGVWDGGPRKQARFQRRIIEMLGERPLQTRGRCAL